MSWNYLPPGNNWPPKPWEQPGNYFGPAPFKPPSSGSTSDIVEASGTTKPGGKASTAEKNVSTNRNTSPPKPWEQNCGNSYGGLYGGYGGSYGSGLYWGPYGGPGMYGWSMHNSGFGCPSANGTSNGGPSSDQYQNNPFGPPPSPPDFWISFLRVMQGIVNFFGRFAMLIDQNTQAFHMFMIALLQFIDRSGCLYGELAKFALRILKFRTTPTEPEYPQAVESADPTGRGKAPLRSTGDSWDKVWEDDENGHS
ncbi:peroxisomal membrane protein 13-like [Typha latifolia]|uniref:peroxisomal membrane protein 13-like n=1 Tax=Typha latifolia TaxID=4733 RepID=UPI003C2B9917